MRETNIQKHRSCGQELNTSLLQLTYPNLRSCGVVVIISVVWCCLFEFMAVNVVWTFWVRARFHVKWFIPGVSWSGSVLHRAEVIPLPVPSSSSSSELWGHRSPHSPSQGKDANPPRHVISRCCPISFDSPAVATLHALRRPTLQDNRRFVLALVRRIGCHSQCKIAHNGDLRISKLPPLVHLLKRTSTTKYYYYKTRRTNNKSKQW